MLGAFAGRTVLLTGAGGFLGTALLRRLASSGCTVRRLLRRPAPCTARCEDVIGDVRDPETWRAALPGVDIVIHLAAQTSLHVAATDPRLDLDTNVTALVWLGDACRALGICPIVIAAGTATQVGLTTDASPLSEDTPDQPITIYDLHKSMAEHCLEVMTRNGTLRGTTLRLTNVYGPGTSGQPDRGFLNAMLRRAQAGEPLTVYGDGHEIRDYVYVEDVVEAFVAAVGAIEELAGQHYVIGSGRGTSIREALIRVSAVVEQQTGICAPVCPTVPPADLHAINTRSFVADTRRFQAATGWAPRVTLEEGLRQMAAVGAAA